MIASSLAQVKGDKKMRIIAGINVILPSGFRAQ